MLYRSIYQHFYFFGKGYRFYLFFLSLEITLFKIPFKCKVVSLNLGTLCIAPSGSPKTLVVWRQISSPNSKGFPPNGSIKQGSIGKNSAIF